jgi:hypothetical protein
MPSTEEPVSPSNKPHSRHRLSRYEERTSGISEVEKDLIKVLALRSYHLPGNDWIEDWFQYFNNNHPILSICCHHRLHPIGVRMRIINLIGSIVFGLCVTNMIWLWFLYSEEDANTAIVTISTGGISLGKNATTIVDFSPRDDDGVGQEQEIQITEGMIILWTVGGGLHAFFDNTIWYVTACVCCLPGRALERLGKYRWCGSYLVIFAVLVFTAFASFAVVLRATLDSNDADVKLSDLDTAGITDDTIKLGRVDDVSAYEFMLSYAVELVLALLVYYPIIGTILFSGILGCGKVPVLGGRPHEVLVEARLAAEREKDKDAWIATGHTATSTAASSPASDVESPVECECVESSSSGEYEMCFICSVRRRSA